MKMSATPVIIPDLSGNKVKAVSPGTISTAEEARYVASPDSGVSESFQALSVEEQDRQREEWKAELAKVEYEVQTLRQVLASKVQQSQELKKKLGVTVWQEFTDDVNQGIKNVKESTAYIKIEEKFNEFHHAVTTAPLYQKTATAIGSTAEKTTSFFGGIGSSVSQRMGALKQSDTFKSFEERVGSAYMNVKNKMGGSRSNSTQSFDDALKEVEAMQKSSSGTPATTPTISEEKPVS